MAMNATDKEINETVTENESGKAEHATIKAGSKLLLKQVSKKLGKDFGLSRQECDQVLNIFLESIADGCKGGAVWNFKVGGSRILVKSTK
jgi:hypothetical protein